MNIIKIIYRRERCYKIRIKESLLKKLLRISKGFVNSYQMQVHYYQISLQILLTAATVKIVLDT